jgi:hypothetical protein
MVSFSCDAGTKGADGWNTSVVDPDRCQLPATGGVSEGDAPPDASAAVKRIRSVALDATFLPPAAGVVERTENRPAVTR